MKRRNPHQLLTPTRATDLLVYLARPDIKDESKLGELRWALANHIKAALWKARKP